MRRKGLARQRWPGIYDLAHLEAKRFMSIQEAKLIIAEYFHIPVTGTQTLRVKIQPEKEKAVIPNLSPAFWEGAVG
jgi:hypothetical protein